MKYLILLLLISCNNKPTEELDKQILELRKAGKLLEFTTRKVECQNELVSKTDEFVKIEFHSKQEVIWFIDSKILECLSEKYKEEL